MNRRTLGTALMKYRPSLLNLVCGSSALALVSVAAACAARRVALPEVALSRPAERAAFQRTGRSVVLTIHSATGIGQADLTVPGRRWPAQVRVRVDGLTIARLEGFTVSGERLSLHSGAGRPWPETREQDSGGRVIERVEDRRYRLPIEVFSSADRHWADVDLPAAMLTGKRLHLEWVDAYRN
jgi:hypothetical protein